MLIDDLIKARGLKNEYIAKKLNINVRTLYMWRKGESYPRLDKAKLLAEILDVRIDDLFER